MKEIIKEIIKEVVIVKMSGQISENRSQKMKIIGKWTHFFGINVP